MKTERNRGREFLLALALAFSSQVAVAQLDIREGLLAEYPLDETSGGVAGEVVAGRDATSFTLNGFERNFPLNWANPGVTFNSADMHYLERNGAVEISEHFTLSAWIKSDSWENNGGVIDLTEVRMLIRDQKLALEINPDGINGPGAQGQGIYNANTSLSIGEEHHVVITNNGSVTNFYIDGTLDHSITHRLVANTTINLNIGVRFAPNQSYFNGTIRDVRVYGRALSEEDVALLHNPPKISETMSGLWVGEVQLDEVKEATTGEWGKAGSPFSCKVIFHSDPFDSMKLLQEAILMKTRDPEPQEAVITRPDLISNYDGIIPRGDKVIGMRFSSATFPMPSDQLAFSATGNGDEVGVTVTLPASHPKNPFRHKYHPDLGVGRALSRTVTITWEVGDLPDDGVRKAIVTEKITGLHKDTLEARGTAVFTRVSTTQLLNP